MDIFQIDDDGRLFMSAAIHRWNIVASRGVDVVIDLEGGLDLCIPTQANHCLYVYFPFDDDDRVLPSLTKLRAIAQLAASLVRGGHTVLTHCSGGFNRSGLVAGLILTELGMSGAEALTRIRAKRPGALYNDTFADYLASVGAAAT
jgi:Tyrosine phosphatase family